MIRYINIKYLFCPLLLVVLGSCKKMTEIKNPTNELGLANVFSSNGTAESAGAGLYASMYFSKTTFNFNITGITAIAADDLKYLRNTNYDQYMNNVVLPEDANNLQMWTELYAVIYQTNSLLEGASASTAVSDSLKNRLTGEAKFIRAFSYFYLVNLYGDVPLITTTDVTKTAMAPRDAVTVVYDQIIADLKDAQSLLPSSYAVYGNNRTRATRFAATALLARVYLYLGRWAEAEAQATALIDNTTLFGLVTNTTATGTPFIKDNKEAIWQFFSATNATNGYATEGSNFVTATANFTLRNELYNAFESGDKRKTSWTRTITISGITYPQCYKYRLNGVTAATAAGYQEFPTVLRLAEQYLIRAEARAQQSNIDGGRADLNTIRTRAGLAATTATDKATLLAAIEKERQVELFCEWGHRWFDLKRTNRLDAVMQAVKSATWTSRAALFPIPQNAITTNPNLTPNP